MTPMVWFFLGSCLVCIGLGAVIGLYGAKLFPARSASAPPPEVAVAARPTASDTPAPVAAVTPAAPEPAGAQAAALSARIDHLEASHHALYDAAAAALAAASLSQSAETGRPFVAELNALSNALPNTRDVDQLRPLAERGAPTRAVLISEFQNVARAADFASRAPADGAGVLARLTHALSALFTVRRTDRLTGDDPDAILARAEHRLNDGDVEGAIHEIDALPPKGRAAAAAWRERAERRVQIQTHIAQIRLQALRTLTAANRGLGL